MKEPIKLTPITKPLRKITIPLPYEEAVKQAQAQQDAENYAREMETMSDQNALSPSDIDRIHDEFTESRRYRQANAFHNRSPHDA